MPATYQVYEDGEKADAFVAMVVSEKFKRRLVRLAKRQGKSVSSVVRKATEEYMDKQRKMEQLYKEYEREQQA